MDFLALGNIILHMCLQWWIPLKSENAGSEPLKEEP